MAIAAGWRGTRLSPWICWEASRPRAHLKRNSLGKRLRRVTLHRRRPLQTFDDYSRTANALAALADLSQHVQVIVLSHHRRLADAARGLPEGTISVCDLAA
jgi:UDP-N-acetylglucosamine 2-epimerase